MVCLHVQVINAQDYIKPIDADVWLEAMRNESEAAPPFYPSAFERRAKDLLWRNFHATPDDITPNNCRDIHLYLVEKM